MLDSKLIFKFSKTRVREREGENEREMLIRERVKKGDKWEIGLFTSSSSLGKY
jgi:hypothetical protein